MTTEACEALIAEGRGALESGDSAAARAAFELALAEHQCGDALAGLAEAHRLELNLGASKELYELAYTAYREERDAMGAYRAARRVAFYHGGLEGDWALFNGWVARARTLLEEAGGDTAEAGVLALARALHGTEGEDDAAKAAYMREALAIGRRVGDADLEFHALAALGGHYVFTDRVAEGMPLLDEALAAVCAGEVKDSSIIEEIFCGLLASCERAHDVVRADQWMRAASDMAAKRKLSNLAALCRAHYGGILTAAGRWPEAERELLTSSRLLAEGYRILGVNAAVRLADLRVHQGRLEEAAQLLKGFHENPDAARPLAALHLARGETALARDRIERALGQPGLAAGVAGPLYALLVDVHLAEGHCDDAATAARHLATLAEAHPSSYLTACAALTKGKICVATTTGDARACLLEALAGFSRAEMPVELARTRLELARAVAADRPEVAVAEAAAALEAFEHLQARRDADAAAAFLRALGAPGRVGGPRTASGAMLTKREREVLELLGHGLTNAEIGDRLYISKKTVEHHVGRVLAKLGLRSRAEAAAHAARTTDAK